MDALKKMFSDLKFSNIKTFIQSGNIIFQSKQIETEKISKTISTNIEKVFGFDVPVITLTESELDNVINQNPFLKDKTLDSSSFHITFLSEKPTKQYVEKLNEVELKNEKFVILDRTIYLYCPDSYSNSKLTNNFLENKLKVIATTRNWKTTKQLFKLASEI